jgi:hypothetical protein
LYSPSGEYVAACKHAEDAGAVVNLHGEGATIRYDHKHIVWREGREEQQAGDSFDFVATTVHERVRAIHEARRADLRARQERFAPEPRARWGTEA